MRICCVFALFLTLTGCGGGSDNATPDNSGGSVPVLAPLAQNSFAQCGAWQQDLDPFKPPYLLKNQRKWIVMGSSSAFGAGASTYSNSWAGKLSTLAAEYGAEVINLAKGGYSTYQAMSTRCTISNLRPQPDPDRNVDMAQLLSADLVIISFPTNDAALGYPAVETASNFLFIRSVLADKQIPLLVLGAQPRNMTSSKQSLLIELDSLLKPRIGRCFVELYPLLVDNAGNLAQRFDAGDGVHVNDDGHQVIFQQVKAALSRRDSSSCFYQ